MAHGVIFFGGILCPSLMMLGLGRTSAASGSLLLNLESLATMAIACLVFRENIDRRLLLGALASWAPSCFPGKGKVSRST